MRFEYYSMVLCALAISCGEAQRENRSGEESNTLSEQIQEVETEVVRMSNFESDILSNGRLESVRYADVYWKVDGDIQSISVRNGQRVESGALLATLESKQHDRAERSSSVDMSQANMQMLEVLIGQGYDPNKLEEVPEQAMELIKVKSGYSKAVITHEQAIENLQNCSLRAPIAGVVANISESGMTRNNLSKPFCRIVDRSRMNVSFTVIENELSLIKTGQRVEVTPYSDSQRVYEGEITAINPIVGNNGMVDVSAQIAGDATLYDGMSVTVHIKNLTGESLSVPKEAVVLRAGKPVVFVAKDGKAEWRYVTTTHESDTRFAISEGVEEGDSVIVAGNTDLAHNSEIKRKR